MYYWRTFLSCIRPETEQEFRARMVQLQRELEGLPKKRSEEVAGKPEEGLYYGMKAVEAITAGNKAEGRRLLDDLNRSGLEPQQPVHVPRADVLSNDRLVGQILLVACRDLVRT